MCGVTWVGVQEVKSGQRGIGGTSLTAAAVREMAAGSAD
jgi:hypothetical protein